MSKVIEQALNALNEKMSGAEFDGSAKFYIEGEGSVVLDANGARESNDDAEVTLIASADVFQDIMAGDLDPTSAFMSGRLRIEGDMGTAMRLSSVL